MTRDEYNRLCAMHGIAPEECRIHRMFRSNGFLPAMEDTPYYVESAIMDAARKKRMRQWDIDMGWDPDEPDD